MNMVIAMIQAGNLAVLVKTAGESMGLREAMYVFFPGFIAVSKSFVFVTTPPCLVKNCILTVEFVSIIVKPGYLLHTILIKPNLHFYIILNSYRIIFSGLCSSFFPCWSSCLSAQQEESYRNINFAKYIFSTESFVDRDSASSFHWLSSPIFSCSLFGRHASVTSPLISTL